jgi:hypothetical protein
MSAPLPLNHRASLFKPFGAVTATWTNKPCRLVPSEKPGRGSDAGTNYVRWSHYIDFDVDTDTIKVMDGTTRASGSDVLAYTDGDGVKVDLQKGDALVSLVVVWVEWRYIGEAREYIRAYCLRDARTWTHL